MTFFDIFSKTKSKTENKARIIADIHEKNSLVLAELQASKQVELQIQPLKIGDYLIGKTIIERKTISDFISSMLSRRLIQQIKQMQQYKQQLLIIEGCLIEDAPKKLPGALDKGAKINPNAIRGFILSILQYHHMPIIFTQNCRDTARYLIILAKQQLKPQPQISLHQRIPKNPREQKQYILESFPTIGPITAKKLLKKYKTIKNILLQDIEELKQDIGKKAEIFKLVDEKY